MRMISFLVAATAATTALADDYGDFDHFVPATAYDGQSFEISVPCLESVVQEYVGVVTDFNSDLDESGGIIYAGNEDLHGFVAIHGAQAESDNAFVSWVEVHSLGSESHINFNTVTGPFSNAAYNEGFEIKGQYDARSLEAFINQCAVQNNAMVLG